MRNASTEFFHLYNYATISNSQLQKYCLAIANNFY